MYANLFKKIEGFGVSELKGIAKIIAVNIRPKLYILFGLYLLKLSEKLCKLYPEKFINLIKTTVNLKFLRTNSAI